MSHSTKNPPRKKPDKPRKDFPLFAHPSGQWARKINKRLYYFGVWADPDAAEERHDKEYPYLKRGEIPPPVDVSDGCTVKKLCDAFMEMKEAKVESGDFSQVTWNNYHKTLKRLVNHFGRETKVEAIAPGHWSEYRKKLAKQFAPTTIRTEIAIIQSVFTWGHKRKLHGKVDFGPDFEKPSARTMRKHKREGGDRLFTRDEVVVILGACDRQLKAMVLLGLNCGFGNDDIGALEETDLDLEGRWVNLSRGKTEIFRRTPLWPETIEALREHLPRRRRVSDKKYRKRVFVTERGEPYVRYKGKARFDVLSPRFSRLLKRLKINGRRGLGFYALRHTHATIGGEAKDPDAVRATMGHADDSMTANYQHGISDERLRAVTDAVRSWLWPPEEEEKADSPRSTGGEGGAE